MTFLRPTVGSTFRVVSRAVCVFIVLSNVSFLLVLVVEGTLNIFTTTMDLLTGILTALRRGSATIVRGHRSPKRGVCCVVHDRYVLQLEGNWYQECTFRYAVGVDQVS